MLPAWPGTTIGLSGARQRHRVTAVFKQTSLRPRSLPESGRPERLAQTCTKLNPKPLSVLVRRPKCLLVRIVAPARGSHLCVPASRAACKGTGGIKTGIFLFNYVASTF